MEDAVQLRELPHDGETVRVGVPVVDDDGEVQLPGKLEELLSAGFADSFRRLHPDARDRYSWWSFRTRARERNVGWRIDYFLLSERLLPKVRTADILDEVLGSDHCPVLLDLED